ncbi:MAG: nucleotidyltransferase family protein, partial [Planctomycetota bacterium]
FLRFAEPGRRIFVLANRTENVDPDRLLDLVHALGHGAVDGILTGSAGTEESPVRRHDNRRARVAAVVLAAGSSTRFPRHKLTVPIEGRPLIARVAEAAVQSGADKVVAVVGHEAGTIRKILETIPGLETVENPRYREGLSASIGAGLSTLSGFDGALLVLGDLPFLGPELLQRVIAEFRAGTAPVCFPTVGGRPGHPVLFRRDLWEALGAVRGDEGGRRIVRAQGARACTFDLEDRKSQIDIDTEEDYESTRNIR